MISPKEIRQWMASVDAFGRPARIIDIASMLGRTPECMSRWRSDGVVDREEKTVRLAMAAISSGVKPWGVA